MKPETFLPDDYRPAEDEPFMNERQLAYFRKLLETWKADILDGAKQTINNAARHTLGASSRTRE